MSDKWRYAALVAVALVCVVICVFGWVVYDRTVVPVMTPVAVAMGAALLTVPLSVRLWRRLVGSDNRWYNLICHIVIVGSVVYTGLLSANFYLADPSSTHTEDVTIESKSKKEHDKYQRIRRHSYRKIGVRYTYHIDVRFQSGFRKTIQVQRGAYRHYKPGNTYPFTLQRGLFGFPIVKDMN
ncbi:MAG: hypothetical protein K2L90_01370 [Muribaculaceae bacterium]|nr:hypothetical protein [Muribaculaceae bacterium]